MWCRWDAKSGSYFCANPKHELRKARQMDATLGPQQEVGEKCGLTFANSRKSLQTFTEAVVDLSPVTYSHDEYLQLGFARPVDDPPLAGAP
jgi:hypothetical protein